MEYLFGIFTTMVSVMAGIFKGHDSSRKQSDDSSADASGEGSVAVGKVDGNFTINPPPAIIPVERIDVPKDIYKESLENAVRVKELEMQAAHGEEKALLQAQIDELNNRLANLPQAFEEAQKRIASLENALEREGNEIGAEKLAEAKTAIENGDFSKADELFAKIETREKLAVERSARAAYARGEIAEQEIRWHDANKHFARAAKLDPCFETLIRAQKLSLAVGDYPSALSLSEEAKKAAIADYGEESEQHAICLNNLGALYQKKNQYKKAKTLYKKALLICKKMPEKNYSSIASSLNNLGTVYEDLGKPEKAEPLYKEALDIYNNDLKKSYPAAILNNLAGIYLTNKQYKEAEPLYKQALQIQRELLGENHPETANGFNNLGGLYYRQGQYKEAEPFCKQGLEIFEAALGPDHPQTKLFRKNYEDLQKRLPNAENDEPQ